MNYSKNKDLFILIISMIIIITFLFFLSKREKIQQKPKHIKIETSEKAGTTQKVIKISTITKLTKGPNYNYDNMLVLIEKYRTIESLFYSQFDTFVQNKENLEQVNNLLNNFEEERINFNNYFKQIKNYYRRIVPNRKKNAIYYYFRVIEDSIDELKNMKEKLAIHLQQEQNEQKLSQSLL